MLDGVACLPLDMDGNFLSAKSALNISPNPSEDISKFWNPLTTCHNIRPKIE
jgi:hypothetical protein